VNPANNSESVPVDSNGWPLGDATTVLFDDRAVPAWSPPLDDPWGWQSPLNGTYLMNFTGQGTVAAVAGQGDFNVSGCAFDAPTFTTSCQITLAPGSPNLIVIDITATKRNATAPSGSGFTNMRVMRPGHWDDQPATPSPEMLAMLGANGTQVFPTHMRFMGITGTNTGPGYYGDEGHHYLDFTMRCLPTDALIPNSLRPGCWGIPWEQVVQFSQATGKGVWINAPVSATVSLPVNTSSYVYEWATLMKNGNSFTGNAGLPAGVPIYLEHSNEGEERGGGRGKGERGGRRRRKGEGEAGAHHPTPRPAFVAAQMKKGEGGAHPPTPRPATNHRHPSLLTSSSSTSPHPFPSSRSLELRIPAVRVEQARCD
jgi:hypothetical protein